MKIKSKIIFSSFLFLLGAVFNVFLSAALHIMFSEKSMSIEFGSFLKSLKTITSNEQCGALFLCIQGFVLLFCVVLVITTNKPYRSKQMSITESIKIPVAAGQGQNGTARFMTDDEKTKNFNVLNVNKNDAAVQRILKQGSEIYKEAEAYIIGAENPSVAPSLENSGTSNCIKETYFKNGAGIVIGKEKNRENIFCLAGEVHSLIIGKTGCGKTRCLVIQTLCALALAGESIVANDPKGELYYYLSRFLKQLGYDVKVLDFQSPKKSNRYNPLQKIIDAVNTEHLDLAQNYAWDLVNILVEKTDRAEPIWSNGEMAVLAAGILCVVYDNRDNPQYQNMTNVYWFISEMCKDIPAGKGSFKPITEYVKKLPDTHPAKPLLGIASVAPEKTAGSFYTSALTTLRLFITKDIYNMTKESDFALEDAGTKKEAVFFILPDEKTTFYPIVSLIVSQMYEQLVKYAKDFGGNRLPYRVNFVLDEFGNFTVIGDFVNKLTTARAYRIRFNLFLQAFEQLTDKYGREKAATIRSNCGAWIYLAANDNDTLKEIETRLGDYTVSTYSLGGSTQKFTKPSSTQNSSLQGRKLLFASELGTLKRPYQIVISDGEPAVMYSPDLDKWLFNKMLGLGNTEHNAQFIAQFQKSRRDRANSNADVALWCVWNEYNTLTAGKFNNLNIKN